MSSFRVTTDRDGSRSFGSRNRGSKKGAGRGRGRGGGNHDDRGNDYGGSGGSYKRGGGVFKRNKRRQGGYYNPSRNGPRGVQDEDDEMGEASGGQKRYTPYGGSSKGSGRGRKNNPRAASLNHMNKGILNRLGLPISKGGSSSGYTDSQDSSGYWKVTIPYGKKSDKDFILKSINSHTTTPYVPLQFHYEGNSAVFHVDNTDSAKALRAVSRKVTMPNGFKMMVIIAPCAPPTSTLNKEVKEQIKTTMSKRYDPATRALSLSDFFNDPDFKSQRMHVALSRSNIATAVTDIIGENIPELVSLDLSNNKLFSIDHFGALSTKCPELSKLNLRGNKLRSAEELSPLGKLNKLEELLLEGNPLCDRYTSGSDSYVSAVRKQCPKLTQLDGSALPAPITFGLDQTTSLPPEKGSFFTNDQSVKDIVCRFLSQYYDLYDSDNRQQLLEAYHDSAVFSMSVTYNSLVVRKQIGFEYLTESRNILKVKDKSRKHKLLKSGKLNIVALLTQLPKTQHNPSSFIVDVNYATPSLLSFVVSGAFKETTDRSDKPAARCFSRTFLATAQGPGIVIINEQFSISNIGPDMYKKLYANQAPGPTPSSSPVTTGPVANSSQQREMVQQFCLQSGMNEEFSMKCLAENGWDYEKAANVFTELNSTGRIPPEAFKK